jgi:hypothetical protein
MKAVTALGVCLMLAAGMANTATAATTAQIVPSFSGGKLGAGTAVHVRFATADSAGGLPLQPTRVIIHLPKGTVVNLKKLPKTATCDPGFLAAVGVGPSACPKESHAGPVGYAHLETLLGGQPTTVKTSIYSVIGVPPRGSTESELSLLMESPAPFPTVVASIVSLPDGGAYAAKALMLSIPALQVAPSAAVAAIVDFSIVLEANFKVKLRRKRINTTQSLITMPGSCPRGGFAWRSDFTLWDGSQAQATATSPCPTGHSAALLRAKESYIKGRAAHLHFSYNGAPPPAVGALAAGPFNIEFLEGPQVSGSIERGGITIATAPPPGGGSGSAAVIDATLQPGDVAHLSDPELPGGQNLVTTFTGYPTINAQCGATTASGITAPGTTVVLALSGYRNAGSGARAEEVVNAPGSYSATFPQPIPPGAIISVSAVLDQPPLEVVTETQAQAVGPCPSVPAPVTSKPAQHQHTAKHPSPRKGSSCAHPLVIYKTSPYLRGDTRYLTASLQEVADSSSHRVVQHWSWKPKVGNVRICAYPKGVTYNFFTPRQAGEIVEKASQYHPKPVHTSAKGGSFTTEYLRTSYPSFNLEVKGYFVQPRSGGHR